VEQQTAWVLAYLAWVQQQQQQQRQGMQVGGGRQGRQMYPHPLLLEVLLLV
jgi:hypothetical protein